MRRVAAITVTPLVRATEWLFGPGVPAISVFFGFVALIWAVLMVRQPATFDTGRFGGMQWMPDQAWIAFFAILALMHAVALFRRGSGIIRMLADLGSAWVWISISASFLRVEIKTAAFTPGSLIYIVMGLGALGHAIYCAGQPRTGG